MSTMTSRQRLRILSGQAFRLGLFMSVLNLWGCSSDLQVSSLAKADSTKVDSLDKVSSNSGDSISVSGTNLTADVIVKIEGQNIPLTVISGDRATFVLPASVTDSVNYVEFWKNDILINKIPLLVGDAKVPTLAMPASSMCQDIIFKNTEGTIERGARVCDVTATVLPACSSDGQTGCQANEDFPAVVKADVAAKVVQGSTLVGVAGTAILSKPDCTVSGSGDCRVDGTTYKAVLASELNDANIRSGITIAGTLGTLSTSMPPACSSEGELSCIANSLFPAVDTAVTLSAANRAKIHSSVMIANLSGTLDNCSTQGSQTCYVTGSYHAATACSGDDSNCFIPTYDGTTAKFKAVDFTTIIPGSIKNGVTIAGVGGLFPNATYPLNVVDGVADITTTNFDTKITSSSNFAWFDRNGARYNHAGSGDIVDTNILTGKQIFSVDGAITLPTPWDTRYGTTVGTGKLKVDCRNVADLTVKNMGIPLSTTFDSVTGLYTTPGHNFVDNTPIRIGKDTSNGFGLDDRGTYYVRLLSGDSYKISTTSGGSSYESAWMYGGLTARSDIYVYKIVAGTPDIYDTLYPYVAAGTSPWGNANSCGGLDSTGTGAQPEKVWEDVTVGGCSGSKCNYKDRATGLEWSKSFPAAFWNTAARACEDYSVDGKSDWRLPTMYDFQTAAIHGMNSVGTANWIPSGTLNSYMWSISMAYNDDVAMATFRPSDSFAGNQWRNDGALSYSCVRP